MNEQQLVHAIKAHIAKGNHASEKAEQHSSARFKRTGVL